MTRLPLGLRAWAAVIGRAQLRAVLDLAEVSPLHFRAMANYSRTCTPASFERIEAAAKRLQLDALPDCETCIRPSVRRAALAAQASGRAAAARVEAHLAQERAVLRARLITPD